MSEGIPQGVPIGAVCATHVNAPAVAVCERCGTFVCSDCLRAGPFGNLCPSCAPKVGKTPWEERKEIGFFAAFVQTAKGTLFKPSEFFRGEALDMGYGSPILWAMLCTFVGGFFALVWSLIALSVGFGLAQDDMAVFGALVGAGDAFFTQVVIQVVLWLATPLVTIVGLFIQAGVVHVGLGIFGGARRTFDTTFRTIAYCQSTALLQAVPFLPLIPMVGPLAIGLWGIVIMVIGLSTAHGTSRGRVVAAILVPICILGICAAALVFAIGSLASGL